MPGKKGKHKTGKRSTEKTLTLPSTWNLQREEMSKTMDELKKARTVAKRAFTRIANSLQRTYKETSAADLEDSFNALTKAAERVWEANDDLEELGTENEEVLSEAQKADLEKTAGECKEKMDEIRDLLQDVLWSNAADAEVFTALQVAEAEAKRTAAVDVNSSLEAYEFLLTHLQQLTSTAKESFERWKQWAPSEQRREIQGRLKDLSQKIPVLVSRKADFMCHKLKEEQRQVTAVSQVPLVPAIRLRPTALPKFFGNKRDFHRWRKDWEALQRQGEPSGSKEVKKFQLLDSLEERITWDLRLSSYREADDIFRVLENRFGNRTAIAIEIVEEVQRMPAVRSHQPRRIVELIQTVEKALQDLTDLGDTGAIKNPLVTKAIEAKLPETVQKEWLLHAADHKNAVSPTNRFDSLLAFLKAQEKIYEQLEHLREEEPRKEARSELRHARTRTTKSDDAPDGCVVCGDGKHRCKLYFCRQFRSLSPTEKRAAVKKLGACVRCLELHDNHEFCQPNFLCKHPDCKDGRQPEHHYYLCFNAPERTTAAIRSDHPKAEGRGYTSEQEDFISKLPAELARQCRNVFSNAASRTLNAAGEPSSLLMQYGLQELPVLMMLLNVTANAGQQIGTLIDLASDTNYITHEAARRLNLRSEEMTLIVHGVGGMKVHKKTRRYLLKIQVKTADGGQQSHQLVCYGLENIADIHQGVTARKLQQFFPDVPLKELTRPNSIDLLISHREGKLAPQRVRVVEDLVLWDGPLGKTVGGTHPDLFEDVAISTHASGTHFARSMRIATVKSKEIPVKITQQLPATIQSRCEIQEASNHPPQFMKLEPEQCVMPYKSYASHLLTSEDNNSPLKTTATKRMPKVRPKPQVLSRQSGRQVSQEGLESRARPKPANIVNSTPVKPEQNVLVRKAVQKAKANSPPMKDVWHTAFLGLGEQAVQPTPPQKAKQAPEKTLKTSWTLVKKDYNPKPQPKSLPKLKSQCLGLKDSRGPNRTRNRAKWEEAPSSGIFARERKELPVLMNFSLASQEGVKSSSTLPS